jgi:hypothetical protein
VSTTKTGFGWSNFWAGGWEARPDKAPGKFCGRFEQRKNSEYAK